jgi:phosphohistidine phosphatase
MNEPLTLYLVRHAIAHDRGDRWPDDRLRPLTAEGRARMRQGARGLARLGATLDRVCTSPLVRARQTARILAGAWRPPPAIALTEALDPDRSIAEVLSFLADLTSPGPVALVGHEPQLGRLAAALTGARAPFSFKKGGVACLVCPERAGRGRARLEWLATPAMLRAVGARRSR